MNDSVFGEIEYDLSWNKYCSSSFCGKESQIALMIAGDEDGEFEKGQYEAYKEFIAKWPFIQDKIAEKILEYYLKKRKELGYDEEPCEEYPEIEDVNQLLEHIDFTGIKVPFADIYGGRSIGLCFDCTWDEENGVGVRLNAEDVIKIGHQDIAI